jgi:hypothetical protein
MTVIRTNLLTDPSCELDTDLDGLADGWAINQNVTGTPTYSLAPGRLKGLAQRVQYSGVADDSSKHLILSADTLAASSAPDDPCVGSYYIHGSAVGVAVILVVGAYDSSENLLGYQGSDPLTVTSIWQRVDVSYLSPLLPAETDHVQVRLQITGIDSGDTIDLTIDDALAEKTATLLDYFDGDTTLLTDYDCAWTGNPEASPSTATSPRSAAGITWADGKWTRQGVMVSYPTGTVSEITVIADDDGVWKMWYTHDGYICLATAPAHSGPWTPYAGNPVVGPIGGYGVGGAYVKKVDATYHMWVGIQTTPTNKAHFTSTNGIAWTLADSNYLLPGESGTFDDGGGAAKGVWWDDNYGTWCMLYEAYQLGTDYYTAGLAMASDIDGPWEKYVGSPVLGGPTLCCSPHDVFQFHGGYYMWFHGGGLLALPTDACRAYGTSPYNWTADPTPVLVRATTDEGVGLPYGQIADTFTVLDGETLCLYYSAFTDGREPTSSVIKLATAPLLATLARTIPLTSGDGQNFAMTAGEHVVLQYTTAVPFDEVASAALLSFGGPEPPAITLTSGSAGVVVTVELVAADTLLRRGACTYQLWFYDSAGDGVVVASGKLTILPAAPQT